MNTAETPNSSFPLATFALEVDYDDPSWQEIDRSRYSHVGDVMVDDCPVVETGKRTVYFRELEFDYDPADAEVLAEAERKNCRQPNRAEAETAIRRYTAVQIEDNPRIGLVGPAVPRLGTPRRVIVGSGADGLYLDWYWAGGRWGKGCRFVVVVCK